MTTTAAEVIGTLTVSKWSQLLFETGVDGMKRLWSPLVCLYQTCRGSLCDYLLGHFHTTRNGQAYGISAPGSASPSSNRWLSFTAASMHLAFIPTCYTDGGDGWGRICSWLQLHHVYSADARLVSRCRRLDASHAGVPCKPSSFGPSSPAILPPHLPRESDAANN